MPGGSTSLAEDRARFCLRCGARLGWRREPDDDRPHRTCPACGWTFYDNPRPCVGALIVRAGKALLARRAREPYLGWWDIPGGFMEAGETPEEALAREVLEETGLQARAFRLLGIFPDTYGKEGAPTLNLHYLVEVDDGEPTPQSDVAELRWFGPGELPQKIAFANGRRALELWARKARQAPHGGA